MANNPRSFTKGKVELTSEEDIAIGSIMAVRMPTETDAELRARIAKSIGNYSNNLLRTVEFEMTMSIDYAARYYGTQPDPLPQRLPAGTCGVLTSAKTSQPYQAVSELTLVGDAYCGDWGGGGEGAMLGSRNPSARSRSRRSSLAKPSTKRRPPSASPRSTAPSASQSSPVSAFTITRRAAGERASSESPRRKTAC